MKYSHSETPTPRNEMKVDYLYYDPTEEAVLICTLINKGQSWINEVTNGKTGLYEKEGFLNHEETDEDKIIVYEIGPKESHPEFFL